MAMDNRDPPCYYRSCPLEYHEAAQVITVVLGVARELPLFTASVLGIGSTVRRINVARGLAEGR